MCNNNGCLATRHADRYEQHDTHISKGVRKRERIRGSVVRQGKRIERVWREARRVTGEKKASVSHRRAKNEVIKENEREIDRIERGRDRICPERTIVY